MTPPVPTTQAPSTIPWRRCAWSLGGCLVLGMLAMALLNYWADPYALFRSVEAHQRPNLSSHARLIKAQRLHSLRPHLVVLGTSRAENAIDPEYPVLLGDDPGKVGFNAALTDGSLYEVRRLAEHAIAVGRVERLVVGLDFIQFVGGVGTRPGWREDRLAVSPRGWPQPLHRIPDRGIALWSWSGSAASLNPLVQTVHDAGWGGVRAGLGKTLQRSPAPAQQIQWLESGFGSGLDGHVDRLGQRSAFVIWELGEIFNRFPAYMVPPEQRARRLAAAKQELRLLCQLAREQEVELWLYTSPVHARLLPLLNSAGLQEDWQAWRRVIAQVVEEERGTGPRRSLQAWDFAGYNSVTTEKVPRDESQRMRYYWETSHFTPVVGRWISERLAGVSSDAPEDFGVPLEPMRLDEHFAQQRARGDAWAQGPDAQEVGLIIRFLQAHFDQAPLLHQAMEEPRAYLIPWIDEHFDGDL